MLELLALAALTAAPSASRLPWLHDDWAAAEEAAAASGKLVAVDVWATWCHTCLSMKNFVLEEKPLGAVAGQHVWLSLDYDQEKNAEFFRLFPVSSFPTFLVVDPKAKQVVARWVGSGTAEEMAGFFKGARRESEDAQSRGGRALAKGDHLAAREIFEAALAKKPLERGEETKLLAGLIEALWKVDQKACAERGLIAVERTEDTAPGLDAVALVTDCVLNGPEDKKKDALLKVRARLEKTISSAAMNALAVDDQSATYSTLADVLDALGEAAQADAVTEKRLAVLEAAAAKAATPKDRATFDAHRVECYLRLKRYDVPEKMLLASEKDFPKDFNPPARLALIYRAKKDYAAAEKAIDRALALGYGPRKMRLHSTKIDVLIDAGKLAEAKKAIAAARADIAKMDAALVKPSWGAALDAQEKKAGANGR